MRISVVRLCKISVVYIFYAIFTSWTFNITLPYTTKSIYRSEN